MNIPHPSHAAYHCSKEGAKLVSIQDCAEVSTHVRDINQYSAPSDGALFWLGLQYAGQIYSKLDERNWFDDEVIDS